METQIIQPSIKNIKKAAEEITNGGLVAFPTETVYGLGADAFNENAVKKIFQVKGRPSDNPLIIHFADIADIKKAGYLTKAAEKAVNAFMPGALTIVLKKRDIVPLCVTAGLDTVAVRVPDNTVALDFIKECKTGIAAPSANVSTRPSPTKAQHVYSDLKDKIRYIIDGGSCEIGVESTILDFSGDKIRLLRRGGIPLDRLQQVLGQLEIYKANGKTALSPGMKYRHYAPLARLKVFDSTQTDKLLADYQNSVKNGTKACILGINVPKTAKVEDRDICSFIDEREYAARLYDELRSADDNGYALILCMLAPNNGIGSTVNNRLIKAAAEESKNG